jgi:riboflavin kinase/FMN adenylyltransferase
VDVIRYPDDERPGAWEAPVLALGNFDGMHRGHMAIIERVRRSAAERRATPVVLTFDPHPTRIVRPDKAPRVLMTQAQKLEVLEEAGIEGVAVVRFTSELSRWEPETFVRNVLVDWMRVAAVWVGDGFLFGRDRTGTFAVLHALGAKYGFEAGRIEPVSVDGTPVSSTRVRRLIAEGRVDRAAALLGRRYYIDADVIRGDGRGRQMGFPTANLLTVNEVLPAEGVYAAFVRAGQAAYPAVVNLGRRPTFEAAGAVSMETHLLNVTMDLYDSRLRLYFVQRLREERTFESAGALARQIAQDCQEAEALLGRVSV